MEGYVAILMPVLLVLVILFFVQKMNKDKYNAIIQISKNIEDQSKIKDLLEDLEEKKKPIDYRRSGVITLFVGLGLLQTASCKPSSCIPPLRRWIAAGPI